MRSYSIGEAAKDSGLTARTIRHYEQIGLIPRAPRGRGFIPRTTWADSG